MTERKRASGFTLMDAAFAADAKFQRLLLRAESRHDYAAAVGVYWLLLADARRGKSAVIDWDDYEEYAPEIEQLQAVRLLNEHGFDSEVFERWAPAYRSVPDRTPGTKSTQSTKPSGHISSSLLASNGVGGVGEGETFMGFKPKAGYHDGSHLDCAVCAPLQEKVKS